jgi:predicted transcriptional regulator
MTREAERAKRLNMFIDFIREKKDKHPFSQLKAWFGLNARISLETVEQYAKQLEQSGYIQVKDDKVVWIYEKEKKEES